MDETLSDGRAARLWATAQALARSARPVSGGAASRVPPLLLFTHPARTPRPWEIASRMPAGSGVVYRAFAAADAEEIAHRLRAATRERGMRLLIGRDADLAERCDADGMHLPEAALSAAYALSGRRPDWILTGAVHSEKAALAARDLDAVVLSPIFPAGGASASRTPLGLEPLARLSAAGVRVVALGGVTAENAGRLVGTGALGVAAIGGVAAAFGG